MLKVDKQYSYNKRMYYLKEEVQFTIYTYNDKMTREQR